ncbi:hypothetical protein J7E78_10865 [Paenibacillus polymyxa]|uniref:hypothetical protein n=1 Tax=Paenibacillus polymyxa TaxID=1406 RepID=UPI001BE5DDB1|nr:hypothetical protein [Paenibacillus polymyxa]MBT2284041.1 hypothetical protein [Paenibacillus polymyxa]
MSNMLSKEQLVDILLQLLERTSFPREQMQNYVNRLFETLKWDGVPYVASREDTYLQRKPMVIITEN